MKYYTTAELAKNGELRREEERELWQVMTL